MALENIKLGAARTKLLEELRQTIIRQTTLTPMPAEDVLMVIGFLGGLGIAAAPKRHPNGVALKPSMYRQVLIANIDKGLELGLVGDSGPAIILPN